MSTSSRRLSQRSKTSKNSHTSGRSKGGLCVKHPDAALACSANPYKGSGLKGQTKASYNRWWSKMLPVNGIKVKETV